MSFFGKAFCWHPVCDSRSGLQMRGRSRTTASGHFANRALREHLPPRLAKPQSSCSRGPRQSRPLKEMLVTATASEPVCRGKYEGGHGPGLASLRPKRTAAVGGGERPQVQGLLGGWHCLVTRRSCQRRGGGGPITPEVKMKTPNHITHNNPALSDGHCRPLHLIWASISSAAEWAGRPQTQDGVASIPTRQSHSAPSVPTGDKSSAHVPLSHVKRQDCSV